MEVYITSLIKYTHRQLNASCIIHSALASMLNHYQSFAINTTGTATTQYSESSTWVIGKNIPLINYSLSDHKITAMNSIRYVHF